MSDMPAVNNPLELFGGVPEGTPVRAQIMADALGTWTFKLFPQLWNKTCLECLRGVAWKKLKFEMLSADKFQELPEGPGVYFFTVEGRIDLLPMHAYIFYAGKAEKGIRSRYRDYLREREGNNPESDRQKVVHFLSYFSGWIFFYYAEFPADKVGEIESSFKDNITPPVNTILKLKGRLVEDAGN